MSRAEEKIMANAKKRIELGVNTKKVKVQFNTSTPTFREVIGNYWVAVVELADMTKVYANNVRILSESVEKLQTKVDNGETLSENDSKRLELDSAQLKEYTEKFMAYRKECDVRFEKCYELILTSGLYGAYNGYATTQNKAGFTKELGVFLNAHNITVTDSLVEFLLSVVGMRTAPANTKVKTSGKTLLIAQTEKRFNELFMHALAQLMVDKNCIKTEQYTFTYEKASVTHIDSKIDTVEVPQEEEKTEPKEEPKQEEPSAVGVSEEEVDFEVLYSAMKVSELKEVAKNKGLTGYSKMKKTELVAYLVGNAQ